MIGLFLEISQWAVIASLVWRIYRPRYVRINLSSWPDDDFKNHFRVLVRRPIVNVLH